MVVEKVQEVLGGGNGRRDWLSNLARYLLMMYPNLAGKKVDT